MKMTIALSTMGRADDAMALYDEACARSTSPSVHMQAAYGRAMLYTRYFDEARRDLRKASAWVNTAVSLASLLPQDRRRAYNLVQRERPRPVFAMHLGDPAEAMRLIDAGIERMQATFTAGERDLHLSVLQYNPAQLHRPRRAGRRGAGVRRRHRPGPAPPGDYYAEHAGLLRRLGRFAEALADYDAAIANGLPTSNRTTTAATCTPSSSTSPPRSPTSTGSSTSNPTSSPPTSTGPRCGTRSATPPVPAHVAAGLDLEPGQPHPLCTRGMLAADTGDLAAAVADYRRRCSRSRAWRARGRTSARPCSSSATPPRRSAASTAPWPSRTTRSRGRTAPPPCPSRRWPDDRLRRPPGRPGCRGARGSSGRWRGGSPRG